MKKIVSGIITAAMLCTSLLITPIAAEVPVLKADSVLVMAKDGTSVFGTGGAIKASDLAAEFDGEVTVKDPSGEVIADDKNVPTGSTVENEGGSVKVLITGDTNADGKINLTDASTLLKYLAKWNVTVAEDASDVDVNTKVNISDASTLLKYLAKWDVKLGNMKVVVDTEPQTAMNEDQGITLWFDHVTNKLKRSDTTSTDENTYTIYAAKNEIEDALMYVTSNKDYADLHVSVTDFANSYGDTVSAEAFAFHYVNMGENGYLPDAMMPDESAYKAKVQVGNSQGYVIKASTTAETYPGLYEATVSLKSDGTEVKRAKVYLNVWDFTLNDADACDTAFGLGKGAVVVNHGMTNATKEETDQLFVNYYEFLLENRINGFTLPYDIMTEEGQAYLDDPRVHTFVIAGHGYGGDMNRTDEQIAEYHELLQAHPEWLEKGYFYYIDEPLPDDRLPINKEAYYSIEEKYNLIQSQFEGGWQMIPLETCHGYNLTDDFYTRTKGFVQVYCPKTYAFTPEKYRGVVPGAEVFLTAEDTEKYGTFEEVIDSWVADGTIKKLWWYFSCSTKEPYPNYNAESEGILPRVAGWQQYMYDVEGILYYATQEYNARIFDDLLYPNGVYGDGILLYPGFKYPGQKTMDQTLDGPIGSVRIEYIRDGIEDFMYLRMAERIVGAEKVDEIINKVTQDMIKFTRNTDVLLAARAELAEIIMTAE